MRILGIFVLFTIAVVCAGCDSGSDASSDGADLLCGPGTHLQDGECVLHVSCGEGTHEENGVCVPNWSSGSGANRGAQRSDCTSQTEVTDCERGKICVDGVCATVECIGVGSCLSINQLCYQGTCTAVECSESSPCALPDVCVNSLCLDQGPGSVCTTNADCVSGYVCDVAAGQCRLCEGNECDETVDPCGGSCTADETCDEVTGTCKNASASGAAWACSPCTTGQDCESGLCVPLSSGKVCLQGCATDNGCVTGWSCQAGACAPAGFSCSGCLEAGCPDGQVCNTISGQCGSPTNACDQCTYDWECGPLQACVKAGPGVRVCKPRCTDAQCPAGTTCVNDPEGEIDICVGGCSGTGSGVSVDPDAGACTNDSDMAIISDPDNDIEGDAGVFGQSCLADADISACTTTKLLEKYDLTSECGACYSEVMVCTVLHCLLDCAADPASDQCVCCRQSEGCTPAFHACTGLPNDNPPDCD